MVEEEGRLNKLEPHIPDALSYLSLPSPPLRHIHTSQLSTLSMLISLHLYSLHSHFLLLSSLFCAPAGRAQGDHIGPSGLLGGFSQGKAPAGAWQVRRQGG